jgi:hypothetical protein
MFTPGKGWIGERIPQMQSSKKKLVASPDYSIFFSFCHVARGNNIMCTNLCSPFAPQ